MAVAVRKTKTGRYAVRKGKTGRYAVRNGGGVVTLIHFHSFWQDEKHRIHLYTLYIYLFKV